MDNFTPASPNVRDTAKRDLLGLSSSTLVITVVARLDPQKRSVMIPDIADSLRRLGARDFIIVMVGSGESAAELEEKIALFKVGDIVRVMGTVERPEDYLAATDVFLLPSCSEGISLAVAEAMAMAIPIVTARAGALPEQLGEVTASSRAGSPLTGALAYFAAPSPLQSTIISTTSSQTGLGGVLVNHTLEDAVDAKLYAQELFTLIKDPALRLQYGARARALVEYTSDWRTTLSGMFDELDVADKAEKNTQTSHNPSAHFAIQNLLLEERGSTDFAVRSTLASFNSLLLLSRRELTSATILPKSGFPIDPQVAIALWPRPRAAGALWRVGCWNDRVAQRCDITKKLHIIPDTKCRCVEQECKVSVRCLVSADRLGSISLRVLTLPLPSGASLI